MVVLRFMKGKAPRRHVEVDDLRRAQGARARRSVSRKSVYVAFDFTVASDKSLTNRLMSIRNDAFKQLGDTDLADGKIQGIAPKYTITSVQDFTPRPRTRSSCGR